MKYFYALFLVFFYTQTVKAQFRPTTPDLDSANKSFVRFKTSVLEKDLSWPNLYLDSTSKNFFQNVLELAKNGDSSTILNESYMTILTVLYSRFILPKEKLLALQNINEITCALNQNLFEKELEELEVVDIKITGDTAQVFTKRPHETSYTPYTFIKEGNLWKLNLSIEYSGFEKSFENPKVKEVYGNTKEKIINHIIEDRGWTNTDKNLWHKP